MTVTGVSNKGDKDAQMLRLLALDAYLNNTLTSEGLKAPVPSLTPAQGASSTPLFSAPQGVQPETTVAVKSETVAVKAEPVELRPVAPVSRWTSIDEEEEKQAMPAVSTADALCTYPMLVCTHKAHVSTHSRLSWYRHVRLCSTHSAQCTC